MIARRVLPFVLIAGGMMMIMRHKRLEFMGQCEEGVPERGEHPHPIGPRGPYGFARSDWSKRVPPMFEMWHKRAHEQEQQVQQPAL
jgi:hypothetical protein